MTYQECKLCKFETPISEWAVKMMAIGLDVDIVCHDCEQELQLADWA